MCKYNLKLLPFYNIALCAVLLACLPVVISFRFLAFPDIAKIGESFLPLLGVLLFTPLAFCEGSVERQEALACRPCLYWKGFAVRFIAILMLALLFVCIYIGIAGLSASTFDTVPMWIGLSASMLVMGSIGLTLGHITRNQSISYLVPIAYFSLEYYTHGQYTGRFFLLSLMDGVLKPEKTTLMLAALMLLALNVVLSMRQVGQKPFVCGTDGSSLHE